jgi:hypothetical protein
MSADGEAQAEGPQQAEPQQDRRKHRATKPGPLLPNKAAEDDPRRWGDRAADYDHDAWLREQRPPHWG